MRSLFSKSMSRRDFSLSLNSLESKQKSLKLREVKTFETRQSLREQLDIADLPELQPFSRTNELHFNSKLFQENVTSPKSSITAPSNRRPFARYKLNQLRISAQIKLGTIVNQRVWGVESFRRGRLVGTYQGLAGSLGRSINSRRFRFRKRRRTKPLRNKRLQSSLKWFRARRNKSSRHAIFKKTRKVILSQKAARKYKLALRLSSSRNYYSGESELATRHLVSTDRNDKNPSIRINLFLLKNLKRKSVSARKINSEKTRVRALTSAKSRKITRAKYKFSSWRNINHGPATRLPKSEESHEEVLLLFRGTHHKKTSRPQNLQLKNISIIPALQHVNWNGLKEQRTSEATTIIPLNHLNYLAAPQAISSVAQRPSDLVNRRIARTSYSDVLGTAPLLALLRNGVLQQYRQQTEISGLLKIESSRGERLKDYSFSACEKLKDLTHWFTWTVWNSWFRHESVNLFRQKFFSKSLFAVKAMHNDDRSWAGGTNAAFSFKRPFIEGIDFDVEHLFYQKPLTERGSRATTPSELILGQALHNNALESKFSKRMMRFRLASAESTLRKVSTKASFLRSPYLLTLSSVALLVENFSERPVLLMRKISRQIKSRLPDIKTIPLRVGTTGLVNAQQRNEVMLPRLRRQYLHLLGSKKKFRYRRRKRRNKVARGRNLIFYRYMLAKRILLSSESRRLRLKPSAVSHLPRWVRYTPGNLGPKLFKLNGTILKLLLKTRKKKLSTTTKAGRTPTRPRRLFVKRKLAVKKKKLFRWDRRKFKNRKFLPKMFYRIRQRVRKWLRRLRRRRSRTITRLYITSISPSLRKRPKVRNIKPVGLERSLLDVSPSRASSFYQKQLFQSDTLTMTGVLSKADTLLLFLTNPILLATLFKKIQDDNLMKDRSISTLLLLNGSINLLSKSGISDLVKFSRPNNLVPSKVLDVNIKKEHRSAFMGNRFFFNIAPIFYQSLVRFLEHCSGRKSLLRVYPFVNQNVRVDFQAMYKSWMRRMGLFERRLGHKFFLEEALHIMHISFFMKDSKLFCSWFKTMIKRISFWKTRSIFKFIKFLMNEYFLFAFPKLNVKGFKVKLKGKISVGGNSRKRRILYRVGETSHSKVELRVLYEFVTINTFTGVQGFQLWIFY